MASAQPRRGGPNLCNHFLRHPKNKNVEKKRKNPFASRAQEMRHRPRPHSSHPTRFGYQHVHPAHHNRRYRVSSRVTEFRGYFFFFASSPTHVEAQIQRVIVFFLSVRVLGFFIRCVSKLLTVLCVYVFVCSFLLLLLLLEIWSPQTNDDHRRLHERKPNETARWAALTQSRNGQ